MPDDFHKNMLNANVSALWERPGHAEDEQEAPHLWPWSDLEPLIDEAVNATDMENADRRVLVLDNPAYRDTPRRGASLNLVVNLQVLMPGETARPHRHSLNALRFVLEGDGGAVTTVDGNPCPMFPGDFLITPGWCWHEHTHNGNGRAIWLDALDAPLQAHFDTNMFESGPTNDMPPPTNADTYVSAGITPLPLVNDKPYAPMFRYPLKKVVETFSHMPGAADGSKRLRYCNPVTGGAAMPGIDCYMLAPGQAAETRAYRTNANMVCLAVEGSGISHVGETAIVWQKNDIFTLPRNYWIRHQATSTDAKLFQLTDRETLARLDYLREEFAD